MNPQVTWQCIPGYAVPMKRLTVAEKAQQLCEWIDSGDARRWRVNRGLSLTESATSCDVTSAAVLRWERGERRPRGRNVAAYYRFLAKLAAEADPREVA